MAIYDTTKTKMVRQELQLVEAGQHYKVYSAKIKNLPENIEKEDFFQLCYGMLSKCDELNIYTFKKDAFEILYKFIVVDVNIDEKIVVTRLVSKIDFMEDATETIQGASVSIEGVNKIVKKAIEKANANLIEILAIYQKEINATIEIFGNKLNEVVAINDEELDENGEASEDDEIDKPKG